MITSKDVRNKRFEKVALCLSHGLDKRERVNDTLLSLQYNTDLSSIRPIGRCLFFYDGLYLRQIIVTFVAN